jgi:ribonuclease HI
MAKYYVVFAGRNPGVYDTWEECNKQVNGYSGAVFRSYRTKAEAEKALDTYNSNKGAEKAPASLNNAEAAPTSRPTTGIFTDGACSGNPGPMAYRVIRIRESTAPETIAEQSFEKGTNNVAEFLALVAALKETQDSHELVYTDSTNAITWIARRGCNTHSSLSEDAQRAVNDAVEWLKSLPQEQRASMEARIKKWDTQAWGEIPADFGRKKDNNPKVRLRDKGNDLSS